MQFSKWVVIFVLLVIASECVLPSFSASSGRETKNTTLSEKSGPLYHDLFQKTEEEKTEEERDKGHVIQLADFTNVANLLSREHSPHVHFTPNEHLFHLRPSLHKLHCVFLI